MSAPEGKAAPKLGGKTVLHIHLLDNSFKTLLIDESTTADDVVLTMAEKVGVADPAKFASAFGLFESKDGVLVGRPLAGAESVLAVHSSWMPGSKGLFVFQVKVFMTSTHALDDPVLLHLFYLQAVYNVVNNMYPVEDGVACKLAALQVVKKFGPYKPAVHKPGFLSGKLVEFLPGVLLAERGDVNWEERIFLEHANLASAGNPEALYMEHVRRLDTYGVKFFDVTANIPKLPEELLLGIGSKGIVLLRPSNKEILRQFGLSEINQWGFKPGDGGEFYFETKDGNVHEFDTAFGEYISALLTDYAHAYMRELGYEPPPATSYTEEEVAEEEE
jgi:hypothetical protein